MKCKPSFELTTEDLCKAIINYINDTTENEFSAENIDYFGVRQHTDDIRKFTTTITFEQEHV